MGHHYVISNITEALHQGSEALITYPFIVRWIGQCQSMISTRPPSAAGGDIKNMSRIQLREYGLLENDENSRKSSRCASNKYLQATCLSLYFLVCGRRDGVDITVTFVYAVRKYMPLKTFVGRWSRINTYSIQTVLKLILPPLRLNILKRSPSVRNWIGFTFNREINFFRVYVTAASRELR